MDSSGLGIRDWRFGKRLAGTCRGERPLELKNPRPKNPLSGTLVLVGLTVLTTILAQACNPKSSSKPASFFPESNEVPGWVKSGETRTFEASRLWEYIDGDAEKYLQAGVQRTLTADYRYKEKIEAAADVYVMAASEGASKVFESESSIGSQPISLGDAARLSKGSLTFRKGPYFVRLVAYQEAPELDAALLELARAIDRRLSKTGTGG